MSGSGQVSVLKSCSDGELLSANDSMTMNTERNKVQSVEPSRLKRTFTLPRNPFHGSRMSKRKKDSAGVINTSEQNLNGGGGDQDRDRDNRGNKKIFRRPSWRKFINKIAQHIGGSVPVKGVNGGGENRVPPLLGQTWPPDQTPGVTGLRNHGNTCFINAVLQCISHTDILAEYFVLDQYKVDLSRRNKLNSKKFGTKGEVTEQLALMLKALWACQYHPELSTAFKAIVERHGNQFKGTQQQDAQEFLQWLLDKVHEDLNTASKKKYKPIKTSGRPDEVIAAEMLANHIRCNNSFVQAVFQAQFRSSLRCQRCLTQSNTFDPFHCISVQLPQLSRHSIYVTVLYTSQQPRQVKIGVSLTSDATISELRDVLESDTSIERSSILLTEICDAGFLRTFSDKQQVSVINEADPIYCIEVPQLKDAAEDISTTSAYVLLCWINILVTDKATQKFGSPYTMQISRETSYEDLQKLLLKEMAPMLHDDILTSEQPAGIFQIRVSDPTYIDNDPHSYLLPEVQHPLFMECVDQALALSCGDDVSPAHVKLVLEWSPESKTAIIADDIDFMEEHSSVRQLRTQSLQGGCPLTLEDCLYHYTKAETLSVEDAWRCPQCQQYLPVVKTLDVWSLPDILVVHFKRFRQQTVKGRNSTKLTTMVDFPVYGFDMTPHLANKHNSSTLSQHSNSIESHHPVILGGVGWSPWKRPRKQSHSGDNMYDLYSVCYHHGTDLETGHYTAACKNPYDNQWYLYDDTKVTNLSQTASDIRQELVNNSAYILFYQRRSGIYVGSNSNSNSSSAASTSSAGSLGDHWVSRMPRFNYVPPKTEKKPPEKAEKPTEKTGDEKLAQKPKLDEKLPEKSPKDAEKSPEDPRLPDSAKDPKPVCEKQKKVLENKATNTSPGGVDEVPVDAAEEEEEKVEGPIYTTSIYINASGDVDIKTSCVIGGMNQNQNQKQKQTAAVAVAVGEKEKGLSETDVNLSLPLDERNGFYRGNRGYATLSTVGHRHTYSGQGDKVYHSDDEAPPVASSWGCQRANQPLNHSQSSM